MLDETAAAAAAAAGAGAGAGLGGAAGYAAAGGFDKDDGDRGGGVTDAERGAPLVFDPSTTPRVTDVDTALDSDARNAPRDDLASDESPAARQGGADDGRDAFEPASRRSRDEDDGNDQTAPDQPADDVRRSSFHRGTLY